MNVAIDTVGLMPEEKAKWPAIASLSFVPRLAEQVTIGNEDDGTYQELYVRRVIWNLDWEPNGIIATLVLGPTPRVQTA